MHIIVDGLSGLDLSAKEVSGSVDDIERMGRTGNVRGINALPCSFHRTLLLVSCRGNGWNGRHRHRWEVLLDIVEEVGGTTLE
jgi:hypothetical protein